MSKRIINEKFKVGPDEYVKLFKNDNFELVVPLTFEASKKYGANANGVQLLGVMTPCSINIMKWVHWHILLLKILR